MLTVAGHTLGNHGRTMTGTPQTVHNDSTSWLPQSVTKHSHVAQIPGQCLAEPHPTDHSLGTPSAPSLKWLWLHAKQTEGLLLMLLSQQRNASLPSSVKGVGLVVLMLPAWYEVGLAPSEGAVAAVAAQQAAVGPVQGGHA